MLNSIDETNLKKKGETLEIPFTTSNLLSQITKSKTKIEKT